MTYILIIGGILAVLIAGKLMLQVKKEENYVEPTTTHEISNQLDKSTKLYIMDSISIIVSDKSGNLDKSGFAAGTKIGNTLSMTPDIMRKYKYVNVSDKSMMKSLFLLKKWQREYVATCLAFVYTNTQRKRNDSNTILKQKFSLLQLDEIKFMNYLNTSLSTSFEEIFQNAKKYSKSTKW